MVDNTKPRYRTERIQCAECFNWFTCQPDNPEDLCECPKCIEKENKGERKCK